MGLASLFQLVYMAVLLIRRSHHYMNEESEGTSGGFPGQEYRERRQRALTASTLPAYEAVAGDERKAEELEEKQVVNA